LAFDADSGASQSGDDETQDVDHLLCTSKHIECPRGGATAPPGDVPGGNFHDDEEKLPPSTHSVAHIRLCSQ
jgi:hypothetical protein